MSTTGTRHCLRYIASRLRRHWLQTHQRLRHRSINRILISRRCRTFRRVSSSTCRDEKDKGTWASEELGRCPSCYGGCGCRGKAACGGVEKVRMANIPMVVQDQHRTGTAELTEQPVKKSVPGIIFACRLRVGHAVVTL